MLTSIQLEDFHPCKLFPFSLVFHPVLLSEITNLKHRKTVFFFFFFFWEGGRWGGEGGGFI
jgi:hypothetical protein